MAVLTTGRCIIYCSGPNSCQELFNSLHNNLPAFSFGLYHSELNGEQRKIAIKDWKMGIIKIMIATNSFGMGINAPDVYLIIHATIPLSMSMCSFYFYLFILCELLFTIFLN